MDVRSKSESAYSATSATHNPVGGTSSGYPAITYSHINWAQLKYRSLVLWSFIVRSKDDCWCWSGGHVYPLYLLGLYTVHIFFSQCVGVFALAEKISEQLLTQTPLLVRPLSCARHRFYRPLPPFYSVFIPPVLFIELSTHGSGSNAAFDLAGGLVSLVRTGAGKKGVDADLKGVSGEVARRAVPESEDSDLAVSLPLSLVGRYWLTGDVVPRAVRKESMGAQISVVKRETTTKVAAQTRGSRLGSFLRFALTQTQAWLGQEAGTSVLRARSNRKRTETKGKETRKGEKARVLPYWVRRLALRVFGGSFECPLRALSLGICSVSISGTILLLIVSDLRLTNKWDRLSTASEAYPTAGNFLTALTVFDDPEASFKVVQNAFLLGRRFVGLYV
ncbi:hypothetical protein DL96DRAFT_1563614 [Flagelloscypha sp. PMI_526]|nr:hypothetical protein DL96DRAFT_1563614 [Flagelloscypha sp. PMI_526]